MVYKGLPHSNHTENIEQNVLYLSNHLKLMTRRLKGKRLHCKCPGSKTGCSSFKSLIKALKYFNFIKNVISLKYFNHSSYILM